MVGTWEVEGECLSGVLIGGDNPWADMGPECEATLFGVDADWTGSATFNGDGTFTEYLARTGAFFWVFYHDCLVVIAAHPSMEDNPTPEGVCNHANTEADMGTCEYVDGDCSCTKPIGGDPYVIDVSGTYTTGGTTLTLTVDGFPDPINVEYCVQGDYLMSEQSDAQGDDPGVDFMVLKRMR